MKLKIDTIKPNPQQPRKHFDAGQLQSLADSISQVGLINPIAVEDNGDGTYILIDGERRLRACKLAGLLYIEASVKIGHKGNGDRLRLAEATSANMLRSDMNPIEQAQALKALQDAGYTIVDMVKISGLEMTSINLKMMLLNFSPVIQEMFARHQLPFSSRLIYAIQRQPVDDRDELMQRLISRGINTESKLMSAFARIEAGKTAARALHTGQRTNNNVTIDGALCMTSNKAVPEQLRVNVTATCKRCGLGSKQICASCPVVELVDHWR